MKIGKQLINLLSKTNIRLFSRYLLVIFICLSLNTLIVSIFSYYSSTSGIRKELGDSFTSRLYQTSMMIDMIFSNIDRTAGQFVIDSQINDFANFGKEYSMYDLRLISDRVKNLNFSNPLVYSIYVYFEGNDRVITSIIGETYLLNDFYDKDWLEGYKKLGFSYTMPIRKIKRIVGDITTSVDVISYFRSFPIAGDIKGAVVINLDERILTDYLTQNVLGKSELFLVTDGFGKTILSSDKSLLYRNVNEITALTKNSKVNRGWFVTNFNDKKMLISFFRPQNSQWQYIAMVPTEKLYEDVRKTQMQLTVICLIFIIIGALLSVWLSYGFYRPIKSVLDGVFSVIKDAEKNRGKDEVQLIKNVIADLYSEKESIREKYDASIPALREKFFRLLLEQGVISRDEYAYKIQTLGISFAARNFRVILFEISRRDRNKWVSTTEGITLVNDFVRDLVKRLLPTGFSALAGEVYFSKTAVILNYDAPGDDREMAEIIYLCNKVIEIFKEKMSMRVFTGIGRCVDDSMEICISYESAEEALKYKHMHEQDRIVYINDVQPGNIGSVDMMFAKEELLHKYIKSCDIENCTLTIGRIFEGIVAQRMSLDIVNTIAARIIGSIKKLATELSLQSTESEEGQEDSLVYSFETLEDMSVTIQNMCRRIINGLEEKKGSRYEEIITKAKSYISNNYEKDISVDEVSSVLGISSAHFLRIFKKEMNCTFVEHLNQIRMNKAVELLNDPDLKVNMIAKQVGFKNTTYFNTMFKNKYGMSPLRFRELHIWKKG